MNTHKHVRNIALNLLARREHSAYELARKLSLKGFEKPIIAEVITELKDKQYQSDTRFCEGFCRARLSAGYGIFYIIQKLKMHKISIEKINLCLAQQDVNWVESARAVLKKHAFRFKNDDKNLSELKK